MHCTAARAAPPVLLATESFHCNLSSQASGSGRDFSQLFVSTFPTVLSARRKNGFKAFFLHAFFGPKRAQCEKNGTPPVTQKDIKSPSFCPFCPSRTREDRACRLPAKAAAHAIPDLSAPRGSGDLWRRQFHLTAWTDPPDEIPMRPRNVFPLPVQPAPSVMKELLQEPGPHATRTGLGHRPRVFPVFSSFVLRAVSQAPRPGKLRRFAHSPLKPTRIGANPLSSRS